MGKKGMSLVEIIAVIVIMGIVASIGAVSAIALIGRQRKNAVVNSLNSIYGTAKSMLYQVQFASYDEYIVVVDEEFCYVTLTDMVENHVVDKESFKPVGNEIYFCFDMNETWVEIGNSTTKTKPNQTGETIVDTITVTFDFAKGKFIRA